MCCMRNVQVKERLNNFFINWSDIIMNVNIESCINFPDQFCLMKNIVYTEIFSNKYPYNLIRKVLLIKVTHHFYIIIIVIQSKYCIA